MSKKKKIKFSVKDLEETVEVEPKETETIEPEEAEATEIPEETTEEVPEEIPIEEQLCFLCKKPIGVNDEGEAAPHFPTGVITPGPIHWPGCSHRYLLASIQQLGSSSEKLSTRVANVEQMLIRLLAK